MCWQCEDPDRSEAEDVELLRWDGAERGGVVQGVAGPRHHPPWAYTVGLTAFGLPELLTTGLPPTPAARLLNVLAEQAVHAEPLEHGDHVRLPGGPELEVVALAEPSVHLVAAVAVFGDEIEALQLVYADNRGRWPWSPSYRDGRGGQPVLGARHGG